MKKAHSGRPVCILYFHTKDVSFVRKDQEMLRSRYELREMAFTATEKWKVPLLFLAQFWFLLKQIFEKKSFVVMVQFAGYHSFLPCLWARFTGLKSIVVVGGTDCVAYPSLAYGNFQNPLLARFTRWTYQLCDVVSAVHETLFLRKDGYNGEAESEQGIFHFMPQAGFRKNVLYNGFDTQLFRIHSTLQDRPERSFLSIAGSLTDPVRMQLKGIDMVLQLAAAMPDARFTLVGSNPKKEIQIPDNVTLLPYVANDQLPVIFNQHRFYLQLSLSEGFPNALCESMACGCIPVVSAVASMPEIVADFGGIATGRNLEAVEKAVADAICKSKIPGFAETVAASIENRYSWERRRQGLLKIIEESVACT